MQWTLLRENRAKVAEKLRRGDYDGLAQTGMGRADELVYLMASLKFRSPVPQERAGIPNDLQKRCLAIMPVLGIPTIANVPERLFKDVGLLRFLGCNAQHIAHGFTQRGPKKNKQQPKRLPCHEDDLRHLLKVICKVSRDDCKSRQSLPEAARSAERSRRSLRRCRDGSPTCPYRPHRRALGVGYSDGCALLTTRFICLSIGFARASLKSKRRPNLRSSLVFDCSRGKPC